VSNEGHDGTMELVDARVDTGAAPVIGALPESRLRRVAAHIDSNLHCELRLADLGAVVHMSPYHFARLFKRATGLPPHRFILQRLIAVAATLLADSIRSIRFGCTDGGLHDGEPLRHDVSARDGHHADRVSTPPSGRESPDRRLGGRNTDGEQVGVAVFEDQP
jgi:hypothetical protein